MEGGENEENLLQSELPNFEEGYYYLHLIRKVNNNAKGIDWDGKINSTLTMIDENFKKVSLNVKMDNIKTRNAVKKMTEKYDESRSKLSEVKSMIESLV